jgi:zeaxanthin glucosyltransferase
MAHLGLICPELSGHLNPMTTLGRELRRRGHEVTLVGRADACVKARQADLGFVLIGEREFPEGAMGKLAAQLGRLSGLKAMRFTAELLAFVAQQPAFFDYPREALPECFHYTGPWHDPIGGGEPTDFPWEKLDGRPLIYASMGTLQNRLWEIFAIFAKACAGLDAQLVLSLGSRDQAPDGALAGAPVVVPFAPQIELLKRTTLAITHAGLNTALESLSQGVPMVAIPITNDQPGVASRLEWLGVAEVVAPSRLSVPRLAAAIERVLREPAYREKARRYQQEIAHLNGLARAADIVDQAISLRKPVLRGRP